MVAKSIIHHGFCDWENWLELSHGILDILGYKVPNSFVSQGFPFILEEIKKNDALKEKAKSSGIIVDHVSMIEQLSSYFQFLYIPGVLARQSDLLTATTHLKNPIFLEKAPFMTFYDMEKALQKRGDPVGKKTIIIDGGTSVGPHDRILDVRFLSLYKEKNWSWGLNIRDLNQGQTTQSQYAANWLKTNSFDGIFMNIAQVLGAQCTVI